MGRNHVGEERRGEGEDRTEAPTSQVLLGESSTLSMAMTVKIIFQERADLQPVPVSAHGPESSMSVPAKESLLPSQVFSSFKT